MVAFTSECLPVYQMATATFQPRNHNLSVEKPRPCQSKPRHPPRSKPHHSTESRDSKSMREYLDRAVEVLKKFGVDSTNTAPQELISLLESVKHLDEAKVLAIADVIQHMSAFNALVRENVESIKIGNRYMDITQMFDSIREDSKRLIAQLDDGKISGTEKVSNWWMKIRRGHANDRFEKIVEVYGDVAKDTKEALKSEEAIMDGYIDFRFASKEAEVLARELLDTHAPILRPPRTDWQTSQAASRQLHRHRRRRARVSWNCDATKRAIATSKKTKPTNCSKTSPRIWRSVTTSAKR